MAKYDINLLRNLTFACYFCNVDYHSGDFQLNFAFSDADKNRCVISWTLSYGKRSKEWCWNPATLEVNKSKIFCNFRAKIAMNIRNFMDEHLDKTKEKLIVSLDGKPVILSIDNVRISKKIRYSYFDDVIHADVRIDGFKDAVRFVVKKVPFAELDWFDCVPELHFILRHSEVYRKLIIDKISGSSQVKVVTERDFSTLSATDIETYTKLEIAALEQIQGKLLKERSQVVEAKKKIKDFEKEMFIKEKTIRNIMKFAKTSPTLYV